VTRLERWCLHALVAAGAFSGLAYGWLRYYGQRLGEFGREPSPWQGLWHHLHVLGAALLLFDLGVTVRGHLTSKLRIGEHHGRRSGFWLGILMAPMVLSGYCIQVVVDERWRLAFAWIHGLASLLFLSGFLAHYTATWAQRRAARDQNQ
jgi:hypothetical protein